MEKVQRLRSCAGWKVATEGPENTHLFPHPSPFPTWVPTLRPGLYILQANRIPNRALTGLKPRRTGQAAGMEPGRYKLAAIPLAAPYPASGYFRASTVAPSVLGAGGDMEGSTPSPITNIAYMFS